MPQRIESQSYKFGDEKPPVTLYKYTSFKNALLAIWSNRVYFPTIDQLNDPFEGQWGKIPTMNKFIQTWANTMIVHKPHMKKRLANLAKENQDEKVPHKSYSKKRMSKDRIGVFSLSATRTSPYMWAHYAEAGTGCCLEFDMKGLRNRENTGWPFSFLAKVQYKSAPPRNSNFTGEISMAPFLTKSTKWMHEKEWRAIMPHPPENDKRNRNKYLWQGGKKWYELRECKISRVIVGNNVSSHVLQEIAEATRHRKICFSMVFGTKPDSYEMNIIDIPPWD